MRSKLLCRVSQLTSCFVGEPWSHRSVASAYTSLPVCAYHGLVGVLSSNDVRCLVSAEENIRLGKQSSQNIVKHFSSSIFTSDDKHVRLQRLKRSNKRFKRARDASVPKNVSSAVAEASTENTVVPAATPASISLIQQVVDHPALIITRNIEWGNVIFGFEQANRYTILDEQGTTVALLAEDLGGMGTAVGRQLLRRRRSFTATVFSADGSQIIFRVRRPLYLINSKIYIEDGAGNSIGEVHQRWHLLKRNYELFVDNRQFARVNGNFLAWDFTMEDEKGGTLAVIDRNFQGFAKELFTDAGKYVIHFGQSPQSAAVGAANTIAAAHPDKPPPNPEALLQQQPASTSALFIPTMSGAQVQVVRPLALSERMAVLAAAISIDFDYFSQHSSGGAGWFPFMMPMPVPYPAGAATEAGAEAGGAAAGVGGEAAAGTAAGGMDATPGAGYRDSSESSGADAGSAASGPERDLGGDGWFDSQKDDSAGRLDDGGGDDDGWGGGGDGGDGGSGLWEAIRDFFGD